MYLAYVHTSTCFRFVFFAISAYLSRAGEQDLAGSSSLLAQWLSQPNAEGVRLAKALCFQVCARLILSSFLALPKKTTKKKDDAYNCLLSSSNPFRSIFSCSCFLFSLFSSTRCRGFLASNCFTASPGFTLPCSIFSFTC